MKNTLRNIIKIAGIVLIAAGICVVGYYTYDLIATNASTQNSLLEAEQLLGDMAAYTGSPAARCDSQPPDAAYSPGSLGTDSPDQDIYRRQRRFRGGSGYQCGSRPEGDAQAKGPGHRLADSEQPRRPQGARAGRHVGRRAEPRRGAPPARRPRWGLPATA